LQLASAKRDHPALPPVNVTPDFGGFYVL